MNMVAGKILWNFCKQPIGFESVIVDNNTLSLWSIYFYFNSCVVVSILIIMHLMLYKYFRLNGFYSRMFFRPNNSSKILTFHTSFHTVDSWHRNSVFSNYSKYFSSVPKGIIQFLWYHCSSPCRTTMKRSPCTKRKLLHPPPDFSLSIIYAVPADIAG